MNVIRFPKAPLPSDARPIGRERWATVYPDGGEWCCSVMDDGGGSLKAFASKWDAIGYGLDFVRRFNATLEIRNAPFGTNGRAG